MNIVLFIHQTSSKKGISLKNTLDTNFPKTKLQILNTYEELKKELKKCNDFSEKKIYILLADSSDRLNQLASMITFMEDKHIILILPDESNKTLSKASQFFPRFFTPLNETYHDLLSVLNNIINQDVINIKHSTKGESKNVRIN